MTPGQQDATIAARVPLDLRADAETLRDQFTAKGVGYPDGRPADLSFVIRRALREFVDRNLHGMPPELAEGERLFSPREGARRRHDRPTSAAAALDVAPRTGTQRARALRVIAESGTAGATADEVIAALERAAARQGSRPPAVNGIARRVTDLLQAGAIEAVPHPDPDHAAAGIPLTRLTRNGSQATVYVATRKGLAWLQELDG